MNMRVCLIGALALGLFCLAGSAQATIFFSDNFESQANYVQDASSTEDADLGAPPIGGGWTTAESEDRNTQVWRNTVTGGFDTPYGSQFVRVRRDDSGSGEIQANISSAAQTQMIAEGVVQVDFDVYVDTVIGGGNLGTCAFTDYGTSYTRAWDASFRGDGTVDLYDGNTFQDSELNDAFVTDAWQHVKIVNDFNTDLWSITIGSKTVSGIGFEGGDMSKLEVGCFYATDMGGNDGVIGIDNISFSSVPEPSSIVLISMSMLGLLAYAWRKRR